jgi:hypothetical protein
VVVVEAMEGMFFKGHGKLPKMQRELSNSLSFAVMLRLGTAMRGDLQFNLRPHSNID